MWKNLHKASGPDTDGIQCASLIKKMNETVQNSEIKHYQV